MTRRRVPNVMRNSTPKISMYNIKNDKMSDLKKYYRLSEHQVQQEIIKNCPQGDNSAREQIFNEAFKRKD